MGNIRFSPWLMLILPVAALIAVITVFAVNRVSSGGSTDDLDEYFLRDAKAMQQLGLPVYWLGTEFTVGNRLFRGPYGTGFGEVKGGGINMTYMASVDHGNIDFDITVYSANAWELAKNTVVNPPPPLPTEGEVTRHNVEVKGFQAELISIPQGTRPVNRLRLVLELDPVVVVAEAASGGPVSPGGPDYSPFIDDPDLLVQVMQDLRPYPE